MSEFPMPLRYRTPDPKILFPFLLWTTCALQAWLLVTRSSVPAVALPAALILGWLLWRWIGYAPALIVATAFLVPVELDIGAASRVNSVLILTLAAVSILCLNLLVTSRLGKLTHSTTLPLFGLAATAGISFMVGLLRDWGQLSAAPPRAQVGGLMLFLLSIGALLLTLHPDAKRHHRKSLVVWFLVLAGLYLLRFVIPGFGLLAGSVVSQDAIKGVFATWLVALSLGQCLFNRDLRPLWRVACGCLVVVSLWSALTLNLAWATGWLPPLVAVLAVIWIYSVRLGVVFSVCCLLLAGVLWEDLLAVIMVGDQQYSLLTRREALRVLYPLLREFPLLGSGMAHYYHDVALYPILGWFIPFSSHNNYVDILAQTGLLGLLLLSWFSYVFLRLLWRFRREQGDGFQRGFLLGCWGGWIGSLFAAGLADWLIPFVYNVGVAGFRASVLSWLFAGAAIATCRSLQDPASPAGTGDVP